MCSSDLDQTGFPADTIILSLSAADWRHRQELEQSNVFEKYTKGLKKTLLVLKDLQKSDDIDLLVKVEASLISMEHSLYAKNDPSVLPSLNAAVRDFEDIKKAVDVVKSSKAYITTANTYHSNKKIHGHLDNIREIVSLHCRLTFDPSQYSFVTSALEKILEEAKVRLSYSLEVQ